MWQQGQLRLGSMGDAGTSVWQGSSDLLGVHAACLLGLCGWKLMNTTVAHACRSYVTRFRSLKAPAVGWTRSDIFTTRG